MSADERLHARAVEAARGFQRAEAELVDALMAVDRARVFLKMGYGSLFVYCVEALGLSEAVAYAAIAVARKSAEVPALQLAVSNGLSLAKARRIVPLVTLENSAKWIQVAHESTSRKLEKEVAKASPRSSTPETASYVSGDRLNLRLGIDEWVMLDLRRAQDQVSRSKQRSVSLEETLAELIGFYLKRMDRLERSKRGVARGGIPTDSVKTLGTCPVRTPIPAAIAHAVRFRDQGRCQFKSGTRTCGERRFVDLHHIQPVSQGGVHHPDNLTTLCRAHHQLTHQPRT